MQARIFLAVSVSLALSACASMPGTAGRDTASTEIGWKRQGGVEVAMADEKLLIVRVDPRLSALELLNPPETDSLGMDDVAERRGLAVVINAAMFATDYATSIGYMRNYDRVNNPRVVSKLRGFLMFNPKVPGLPPAQIAGQDVIEKYHTVFQSHRMWDVNDGILWKKGKNVHDQVGLVGVDGKSRVLFFFHPTLVDVHDMVAHILELRLDLKGLLYLDGGTHAGIHLDRRFGQRSVNADVRVPNLIGVKAR